MKLSQLLAGVKMESPLAGDPEIVEVRDDSRQVGPGDLFVAVRGQTVDGHDFLATAAARGAAAAVIDRSLSAGAFPGPTIRVPSSARALGTIAANRYDRPAEAMTLIGVTGTNGKTTSTYLFEALVQAAGGRPGVLGTVSYRFGSVSLPAPHTTPTPLALHATLAEMRAAGCTHVALECSSHAAALGRLEGIALNILAFTNLTQDHLDFHGTMEAYRDAKADLFSGHVRPGGSAVILVDHPYSEDMVVAARTTAGVKLLRVSTRADGDIRVIGFAQDVSGLTAQLETPVGQVALRSPLIGRFNLENLAVAVGVGVALGLSPEQIASALAGVSGVPGRLERVLAGDAHGLGVFVDYAHTPDALERVMAALRPLVRGRLIVVFGCGGDRDRTKRPLMGRAAARDADLALVTSDNPRTEDPQAILEMILDGVKGEPCPALSRATLATARRGHLALVDRRAAIGAAIEAARPGDVVLIAGKGHEDYQIVGKTKLRFDDREEAAAALEKLAKAGPTRQSEREE